MGMRTRGLRRHALRHGHPAPPPRPRPLYVREYPGALLVVLEGQNDRKVAWQRQGRPRGQESARLPERRARGRHEEAVPGLGAAVLPDVLRARVRRARLADTGGRDPPLPEPRGRRGAAREGGPPARRAGGAAPPRLAARPAARPGPPRPEGDGRGAP